MTAAALPRRLRRALGIRDFGRFLTLVATIALAQFRLRYLDAALSWLWAVARPTFVFGVMWVVFTQVAHVDEGVPHYAAYLFAAIVLWTYFGESTSTATQSLLTYGHLLRKIPVPPVTIPIATALTSFFDLLLSLVAVLTFAIATGVEPRLAWFQLPVLVAILTLLVTGFGMLLSVAYVKFRDVDQIWVVARQALFYLTPIFYVLASVPEAAQRWMLINPLTVIFTQMRYALIDPDAPTAAAAAGGWVHLLPAAGIVVGVLVAGVWSFASSNPWLAERL